MAGLRDLDVQRRLIGDDALPITIIQIPEEFPAHFPALEALAPPLHLAAMRLEEAQQLWVEKHWGPSVVLAQTVAETYFQSAVVSLFAIRDAASLGEAVSSALRGINLNRKEHRRIYDVLSGDPIPDDVWRRYNDGRHRRNAWVHGLEDIPEAAAGNFVVAVVDLIGHVDAALRRRGVKAVCDRYRITEYHRPDGLEILIAPLDDAAESVRLVIQRADDTMDLDD